MGVLSRTWKRYRARKSLKGIVLDFAFLAVVIILAIAPLRRAFMTGILRMALVQPEVYEPMVFLTERDNVGLLTSDGRDTSLTFPPARPTLINTCSPWSAQSRAELRSMAKAAETWTGMDFILIVEPNEAEEMASYLSRRGYSKLHLMVFRPATDETMDMGEAGLRDELRHSVPATIVVDAAGQVIAKKTGAARWTGITADKVLKMATEVDTALPKNE